ncbi:MAG: thioredoxin domain-containing protein, partial [Longimicrobiales bacterium]
MDWYPWGTEALTRAREEDKPILLSVGYSACHWCHVMERESFEDPETAAFMNESFINIKVDREERPDLDAVYMQAVQTLTGHGGWPLTAFLTPDGKAFYGGTYFPPQPRHGMPSFRQVLEAVMDGYQNRRDQVERGSDQLLAAIRRGTEAGAVGSPKTEEEANAVEGGIEPSARTLEDAFRFLQERFDPAYGGFGPAPKFPQPTTLEFLLRYHHRTGEEEALVMVAHTLLAMARGGLRDHLGGGFHRYSVDEEWLVPHFEKMLYDNGLLARVYLHAYQITGIAEFLEVATSTLDYVLEDLRDSAGGFYSARDADSEGEEGLFYLWEPGEVEGILGEEEARFFMEAYGVTAEGNFEGRNILHLARSVGELAEARGEDPEGLESRLQEAREKLREARGHREAPFRDEKVLTGWNAFVLRVLAEAGAALGREDYLQAARENAEFLLTHLRDGRRILRSWKDGAGKIPGFLEDYAGLANALLTLHEATLEPRWLQEAEEIMALTLDLFWDPEQSAFFDTPRDGEPLVVRPRDIPDKATPSGHSLAVELLLRGADVFGLDGHRERAGTILKEEEGGMARFPSAFGRLLSVLSDYLTGPVEVVLLGAPGDPELTTMLGAVKSAYHPRRTVVGGSPEDLPALPMLEGRDLREGRATAYVCRDFSCSPPIHTVEEL